MIVPSVTELTYVWAMPAAGPASPTLHVIVVVVPLLTRFDILKLFPYDGSVFAGPGWFPVTPLYVHEKLSASSLNAILSPMETAIVGFGNETVNSPDVELYVELFGVTVEAVTTSNVKGKKKIYRGKAGKRVNWKKAVVKVSEGQMIDATAS